MDTDRIYKKKNKSLWERVWEKISVDNDGRLPNPHWVWKGRIENEVPMHTKISVNGEKAGNFSVRRFLYERIYGKKPPNRLTALCGEKKCVNPKHIGLPITYSFNKRRRIWINPDFLYSSVISEMESVPSHKNALHEIPGWVEFVEVRKRESSR